MTISPKRCKSQKSKNGQVTRFHLDGCKLLMMTRSLKGCKSQKPENGQVTRFCLDGSKLLTKSLEEVRVAGNQLSNKTRTDKIADEEKGKVITFTKYKARTGVKYHKHVISMQSQI